MKMISRKEFLNYSTQAAIASLLTPLNSMAKTVGVADRKIKVAVIGCGTVSTQYLPHISKSPFVELVSTCDIIHERAIGAAKQYNIPTITPTLTNYLPGPNLI